MNMKEWVDRNQQVVNAIDSDGDVFDITAVDTCDISDLLKAHAIVPRKIPRETLLEIQSEQPCTIRKMIELFIEISERDNA